MTDSPAFSAELWPEEPVPESAPDETTAVDLGRVGLRLVAVDGELVKEETPGLAMVEESQALGIEDRRAQAYEANLPKWRLEHARISALRENPVALNSFLKEWQGFVRLVASSYFLEGGEQADLVQEGMLGLFKAVRDYTPESSFRSFAQLCVSRQIITAIKTATRYKHSPLNTYLSFNYEVRGHECDTNMTIGEALPAPAEQEPSVVVISTDELQSLVSRLGSELSKFESDTLRLFLNGTSYIDMAEQLDCDTKSIDNALQRVKRKIKQHQKAREVLL
jgi:RNA polymerase sporulation-specific sigma factor